LPDAVRELVILRIASRQRFGYEWSHHQRPAKLAGLDQDTIDALTAGDIPDALPDALRAALEAVDAVVAKQSIPAEVQQRFVAVYGNAGIVELVALCGLYAIMGHMVTAFDIEIEEGLPDPPF
jgi:4-carboxymuconolactone decarboxylase